MPFFAGFDMHMFQATIFVAAKRLVKRRQAWPASTPITLSNETGELYPSLNYYSFKAIEPNSKVFPISRYWTNEAGR